MAKVVFLASPFSPLGVHVWRGFGCLGWGKLTLAPSSGIPKKFLINLKRTWNQKLSPGLMLLTFMNAFVRQ